MFYYSSCCVGVSRFFLILFCILAYESWSTFFLGSDVIKTSLYSTTIFFHCYCCASHTCVFSRYRLPCTTALLWTPILQRGPRSTSFLRVLPGRSLFPPKKTREHTSTSRRRLKNQYRKRMPLRRGRQTCQVVFGCPGFREPAVPGVRGTRHSKSRDSPGTNPGRPLETLPGSRYQLLVPGRNPIPPADV